VAARKRRRVILLLSMMQSSHGVPARAPPILPRLSPADPFGFTPDWEEA